MDANQESAAQPTLEAQIAALTERVAKLEQTPKSDADARLVALEKDLEDSGVRRIAPVEKATPAK